MSSTKAEERNLEVLRGIEALGGAKGYKLKSLEKLSHKKPDPSKRPRVGDWPQVTSVVGNTWSAFIYTRIDMTAPQTGDSGSGHAWGAGIGDMGFAGLMGFSDWATLKSAPNDFYVIGDDEVAGGILIYLSVNGSPAGVVAAATEGLDVLIGLDGSFVWK
ncbi:hypothetical protein BDY19DRAFT_997664 [Irpex rosettiformis]|uniref:Uncharacterized protein n=1 Tax=Irpex rosettiformis TaxID=378272 RepID=A0ACB8TR34_9APHY|nr:hypothetical protein BDY19DRAFT_997664 [Irpex rosettiformis]